MESFFNISDSCKINNTIFKKHFYDNFNLSSGDKNIFIKNIEKIQWLYCLKPDNFYVRAYKDEIREYPEIEIIEVILVEDKKLNRIAEIIMRAIPYPIVILFLFKDKIQICVAHQRTNQNDETKNIIEDFIFTKWLDFDDLIFDKLDFSKMNLNNFYSLYSNVVDEICIYNAKRVTDKALTGEEAREITERLKQIDKEIELLNSRMSKETQFNKRVEIGLKLRELESIKESISK